MERVIELLQEIVGEVEKTGERRSTKRSSNVYPSLWRDDPALRHNISQLKVMSEGLGAQCTKLALLAHRSPTEEHFESLFREIAPQLEAYKIQFINFSNCSLSLPLLLIVSMPIRHFLKRLLELCETIKAASYEEVNSLVGMIHECAEDIKKVPETNKVAYKRAMMDKIVAVNDVINEFSKHVNIYKNKYGENANSNNEDNRYRGDEYSNEGSDEEGEYTAEEVELAEKCLKLVTHTRNIMKVGVGVCSEIADALHPLSDEANQDQSGQETVSVFTSPQSSPEQQQCQEWVAQVLRDTEMLETGTVDVGSELYAPLDNPDDLREYYNALLGKCAAYLQLITARNWIGLLSGGAATALEKVSEAQLNEFEAWSS